MTTDENLDKTVKATIILAVAYLCRVYYHVGSAVKQGAQAVKAENALRLQILQKNAYKQSTSEPRVHVGPARSTNKVVTVI